MAVLKEVGGHTYRVIVTRFRCQKDLDEYAKKLGMEEGSLSQLTTEVLMPSCTIKNKKPGRKKIGREAWRDTWKGQPYFINDENEAYAAIKFHFDVDMYSDEDLATLMDQNITDKTKSAWMPKNEAKGRAKCLRVVGGTNDTHFPIYVVSKGRADVCKTSEFLSLCEVAHYVVVEEFQYQDYLDTVGKSPYTTVLTVPQRFFDEYETLYDFEETGEKRLTGPGAARNYCWWHSKENGYAAHHVLDDNMYGFYLLTDNCRVKLRTGAFIKGMEEHFMAFDNVAIAGPNYRSFVVPNSKQPSHVFNTRIYSWLLIRNDIPFKWRGTWNEDTILSLDVLKAGWATLQWNFYLQYKMGTQLLKGGNTEEFYEKEGTLRKSQMLVDVHPDVSQVVFKFGRWHHEVNYSVFKHIDPQFRPERLADGVNDYGLYMVKIKPEEEYTVNPQTDTKSYIEQNYSKDDAVYLFDGTRWVDGFDLYEDYKEKGY